MNFIPGQNVQENVDVPDVGEGISDEASFIQPDAKKLPASPAMLAVLGLAVIGGAVYFLGFRTSPRLAAASAPGTDSVAAFLSHGEQHVQLMRQTLQNTDKVVQQFRGYANQTQIPLQSLKTNPFLHGESTPQMSDINSRRHLDEERATATAAVQAMRLQSILNGGRVHACMINGVLYQQGQSINRFLIERVNPNSIILRTGTFRFELSMGGN